MNRLDNIEETQQRNNIPQFQPGDTVRVHVRIKESETKERLQAFEGVVIARKHGGARETITVRKTSSGVGGRQEIDWPQRSTKGTERLFGLCFFVRFTAKVFEAKCG